MTKYNTCDQDEYLLKSNLLGAQNIQELEQLERVAFYLSSSKAENDGFDFLLPISADSVIELHKVLFKNIYNFAGKFREVSLMKDQTRFCEPQFIEEQLNRISKDINEEETWGSMEQAAAQLAYYKTESNILGKEMEEQ